MNDFLQKLADNKIAVAAIVLTIAIIVLYFVFRPKKKTARATAGGVVDVPDPTNVLSDEQKDEARSLAGRLYNDMDGANVSRDLEPYEKLRDADDQLFIATYNTFNQSYGDGETLREWLENEYISLIPDRFTGWLFDDIKTDLLNRFADLGLE